MKSQSKAVHFGVYLAVRALVCLLQMLTPAQARRISGLLAAVAYRLDRRHRQVADDNLRHAFSGLTDSERDCFVRATYRHFCGMLLDIVQLPRVLNVRTWRRHLDLSGGKAIVDALLSNKPLLFVTGHFGNWEMSGYALGLLGFRTHAIARRLDNPYLDQFFRVRFRQRTHQSILDKSDDYERIQGVLAERGVLATLADQDAGAKGQFIDFFGRPASTHKAVALLALEYGATMIVLGTAKVGEPMSFRCEVADVIEPSEYAGRSDAVRTITQRFSTGLEQLIRHRPEQYFWLHRRWKHQPARRKAKKPAA